MYSCFHLADKTDFGGKTFSKFIYHSDKKLFISARNNLKTSNDNKALSSQT